MVCNRIPETANGIPNLAAIPIRAELFRSFLRTANHRHSPRHDEYGADSSEPAIEIRDTRTLPPGTGTTSRTDAQPDEDTRDAGNDRPWIFNHFILFSINGPAKG